MILTLFDQNRKYYNQNNKILSSHMALQVGPLISMMEPSNSVPGSSDKYAQLSTAGNFKIIWDLDKIYCAMWVIISVIIHKNYLTQTDNHQFPDKLFWSCWYYPNQTRSTTGFKYLIQVHFYFNSRQPLKKCTHC